VKLLNAILGLVRRLVKVIEPGHCIHCHHGANPTLGVPLRLTTGGAAHLVCLIARRTDVPAEALGPAAN